MPSAAPSPRALWPRLARFAWAVLAYNLLVIAWGAFVRATGSGAGCGRHWPLCNGEVIPRDPSLATLIEVSHRATSGIALVLVVTLAIAARRALPVGHVARRASVVSVVLVVCEALIGAGLVLFELVAHDASMKRGLSMVLHLSNTFLLLGGLAVTAWSLSPGHVARRPDAPRAPGFVRAILAGALGAILLLGASGAIAALGDTLFPSRTLSEGIAQDLSPVAHVFLRLRMLHPVIALLTGVLVFAAASVTRVARSSPRVNVLSRALTIAFGVQFSAGVLNMTLLAPVPMQLVHLLLADATWILLVLLAWEAVVGDVREASEPSHARAREVPAVSEGAREASDGGAGAGAVS